MREAGDADTAATLANGDARTRSPLTVIERAASEVLHRENGEYQALRLAVSVDESADGSETTDEMQAVASVAGGDGRTVTATGGAGHSRGGLPHCRGQCGRPPRE